MMTVFVNDMGQWDNFQFSPICMTYLHHWIKRFYHLARINSDGYAWPEYANICICYVMINLLIEMIYWENCFDIDCMRIWLHQINLLVLD